MRKFGLTVLVCGLVTLPYAALSQESAVPSPEDYVCAMTGECGEEDEAADGEAPAQTEDGARVNATRGFALSGSEPASRPKATPSQTRRQPTTRPSSQSRPAAQTAMSMARQVGRVDLRVGFALGSTTLTAEDQARIQAFAEALKRPQLASSRIQIEGHTDSSGGRALNMRLSRERAQAVADYLVSQGIARDRLEVRGFGYDQPLPNRRASAPENRRVEAVRISS